MEEWRSKEWERGSRKRKRRRNNGKEEKMGRNQTEGRRKGGKNMGNMKKKKKERNTIKRRKKQVGRGVQWWSSEGFLFLWLNTLSAYATAAAPLPLFYFRAGSWVCRGCCWGPEPFVPPTTGSINIYLLFATTALRRSLCVSLFHCFRVRNLIWPHSQSLFYCMWMWLLMLGGIHFRRVQKNVFRFFFLMRNLGTWIYGRPHETKASKWIQLSSW